MRILTRRCYSRSLNGANEDEEARRGRSGADDILWAKRKRKREEAGKLVGGRVEIGEGVNGRWEDVVAPVIVDDIWAVLKAFHMLSLRVFTAAVNSVLGAINIAFVNHGIFPMSDAEVQLRCRRRYMCEKRRSTKEATQKRDLLVL